MIIPYRTRLAVYESAKAALSRAGLSYSEYEQAVKALAKKWGV